MSFVRELIDLLHRAFGWSKLSCVGRNKVQYAIDILSGIQLLTHETHVRLFARFWNDLMPWKFAHNTTAARMVLTHAALGIH